LKICSLINSFTLQLFRKKKEKFSDEIKIFLKNEKYYDQTI
jgi:hypothetical protein